MKLDYITLFVSILMIVISCFVLLNMLGKTQREKKIERKLKKIKEGSESKDSISKLINKNKYLKKLADDLDVKISMCGLDNSSHNEIKKSLVFSLIGVVIGIFILNPIASILFAVVGFAIPIININDKFYKKFKQIDRQILQALQLFLNEYQKTKNITEVLESICPRLEYPIRSSFEKLLRQINSGINFKKALYDFSDKLKNEWIYMFVHALIMNKENGSEIISVLMRTLTKIANKEIIQRENDMETFSGRILNKMMMITVPVAFVLVLIAQPVSKELFFYTFQGKMVINVSVILCMLSFIITRITEKF